RRRHTRFSRDWSSDVCSSDLLRPCRRAATGDYFVGILAERRRSPRDDMVSKLAHAEVDGVRMSDEQIYGFMRNLLPAGAETTSGSEERRVRRAACGVVAAAAS